LEQYHRNAEEITVVMTDIGMPVMGGFELIRERNKINPKLLSSSPAALETHIHHN
jgi:CheY-like chemotaxis protein